jgi:hypothetical protein
MNVFLLLSWVAVIGVSYWVALVVLDMTDLY